MKGTKERKGKQNKLLLLAFALLAGISFIHTPTKAAEKAPAGFAINENEIESIPMRTSRDADSDYNIGFADGTLENEGDYKLYNITIEPNALLQVFFDTDNRTMDVDYDLYLLDTKGNILSQSNIVQDNTTNAFINDSASCINYSDSPQRFLIGIHAKRGGGVHFNIGCSWSSLYDDNEKYLNDSIINAMEIPLEFYNTTITDNNINSFFDTDWFKFTVPEDRKYEKLQISASMTGKYGVYLHVYRKVSNTSYKLEKISSNGDISALPGEYYLRVLFYGNSFMPSYIKNYNLNITCKYPISAADTIVINKYESELNGSNSYEHMGGDTKRYYAAGSYLNIYGKLFITDPATGTRYPVFGVSSISASYYNRDWAGHYDANTNREATATVGNGDFLIMMKLPPARGGHSFRGSMGTSYYDICDIRLTYNDLVWDDIIYQKATYILG